MRRKNPVVRPITRAELPDMIRVWKLAGLPYRRTGRDSISMLGTQLKRNPDLFIGAFIEGELAGVVIGSDDGRRGWVNRLAVLPEARRTGVAGALVRACEKALRKRGRRLFCATIERENMASLSLFDGLGYLLEENILYLVKREDPKY